MTNLLRNHLTLFFGRPTDMLNPFSAICEGWVNPSTGKGDFEVGKHHYFTTNYKLPTDFDPIGKTRKEIQDVAFKTVERIQNRFQMGQSRGCDTEMK